MNTKNFLLAAVLVVGTVLFVSSASAITIRPRPGPVVVPVPPDPEPIVSAN